MFLYFRFDVITKGGPLGIIVDNTEKKAKKAILRYFKRSGKNLVSSDPMYVTTIIPYNKKEDDSYISCNLPYSEVVKRKRPEELSKKTPEDDVIEKFITGESQTIDEENIETSQNMEQEYWNNLAKNYNQNLSKDPNNVKLWLEFIKFQDKAFIHLFQTSEKEKQEIKKNKKNSAALAERKLSILDNAIKKNSRSLDLQFKRLEVGKEIWNDQQLKQECGKFLFNFPNSIEIWHYYLYFMITHFSTFELSSVIQSFKTCTEKLKQMQSGSFITRCPAEKIGLCLVDVSAQLANVWYQSGYIERSIAVFQALVELNIFAPEKVKRSNYSFTDKLALFESFWDSRAPR